MKRRINLLSINFTKRELSEVVLGFRMKALIVLIILTVIGVAEYGIFLYLRSETEKFEITEQGLTDYLVDNDDIDQRLKYFFYKYNLLNTYLEEDADGYAHYTQVTQLISENAQDAEVSSFSYKNNGETTVSVKFSNYDAAAQFIAQLETPVFLDVFQFVRLEGFEAIGSSSGSEGFTITLFAQFIEENET